MTCVLSHNVILEHIQQFMVEDCERQLLKTKQDLANLAESLPPTYQHLVQPETTLFNYLKPRFTEIAFWANREFPGQSQEELDNELQSSYWQPANNPVRVDLDSLNHCLKWYLCKDCLAKLTEFFIQLNLEIGQLEKLQRDQWPLLFCQSHFQHLITTKRLKFWKTVWLRVLPNQDKYSEEGTFQVNLIIYLYHDAQKWC